MVAARDFIWWVEAFAFDELDDDVDPDPETPSNLLVYDGADWVEVNVFVYDGAGWAEMEPEVSYYTGSVWDT